MNKRTLDMQRQRIESNVLQHKINNIVIDCDDFLKNATNQSSPPEYLITAGQLLITGLQKLYNDVQLQLSNETNSTTRALLQQYQAIICGELTPIQDIVQQLKIKDIAQDTLQQNEQELKLHQFAKAIQKGIKS